MTDELEELRQATERGDRNDEESREPETDFVDEIVDAIDDVESGDRPKTLAVRDQPIAALLAALDDNGSKMVDVGQALQDELGRENSDEFDRSEIVRLALRVGLEDAAPEKMEQLGDAIGKHAQDNI